jgi:hypothetical protein
MAADDSMREDRLKLPGHQYQQHDATPRHTGGAKARAKPMQWPADEGRNGVACNVRGPDPPYGHR